MVIVQPWHTKGKTSTSPARVLVRHHFQLVTPFLQVVPEWIFLWKQRRFSDMMTHAVTCLTQPSQQLGQLRPVNTECKTIETAVATGICYAFNNFMQESIVSQNIANTLMFPLPTKLWGKKKLHPLYFLTFSNHKHTHTLRFNGHFSRWTWVTLCLLKIRMMEVVVTTGVLEL